MRTGSIYQWKGGQNPMARRVNIPWTEGSKYHGQMGQTTMDSGSKYHGQEGQNTMGRGPKYHGYGGQNTRGKGIKISWIKFQFSICCNKAMQC